MSGDMAAGPLLASRIKLWFLAGLFLLCICGLMLQIAETRVLSVISHYHLAFSR
jgi:hypothetical protein